jgi:hypothetical protein
MELAYAEGKAEENYLVFLKEREEENGDNCFSICILH